MSTRSTKRLTRAEQRRLTRATLIDAASRVISRRGLYGASIEAIVAEAGFTGGAFYSNFESKDELFAAVLEERVFKTWREIMLGHTDASGARSPRQVGEISAALNEHPDARWTIQLWLELMTNAGRDERYRETVARLWRESRAFNTTMLAASYEASGEQPPVPPEHIATAMMALETGLSLQHYADPEAVPTDLIPRLFALLLEPLLPKQP